MGNWRYSNNKYHNFYFKQGDGFISFEDLYNKVREIGWKYGVRIQECDFGISDYDTWRITPYEGDSGFTCQDGDWWGENMDSYSIRFMEGDFDMFDEIAEYLKDTDASYTYEYNEETEEYV